MMTKEQFLLMKCMEEASEFGVRCSKAARFGQDQIQPGQLLNNRERIIDEFNDLVACMQLLGIDPFTVIDTNKVYDHQMKVEKYMDISRDLEHLE